MVHLEHGLILAQASSGGATGFCKFTDNLSRLSTFPSSSHSTPDIAISQHLLVQRTTQRTVEKHNFAFISHALVQISQVDCKDGRREGFVRQGVRGRTRSSHGISRDDQNQHAAATTKTYLRLTRPHKYSDVPHLHLRRSLKTADKPDESQTQTDIFLQSVIPSQRSSPSHVNNDTNKNRRPAPRPPRNPPLTTSNKRLPLPPA